MAAAIGEETRGSHVPRWSSERTMRPDSVFDDADLDRDGDPTSTATLFV
jgi:hypothetical protein